MLIHTRKGTAPGLGLRRTVWEQNRSPSTTPVSAVACLYSLRVCSAYTLWQYLSILPPIQPRSAHIATSHSRYCPPCTSRLSLLPQNESPILTRVRAILMDLRHPWRHSLLLANDIASRYMRYQTPKRVDGQRALTLGRCNSEWRGWNPCWRNS